MRVMVRQLPKIGFKLVLSAFLISLVIFFVTNALGDAARSVLGRDADPQELAAFRTSHGLDRPLMDRYGSWLENFAMGDWGTSYSSGTAVTDLVVPRLKRSLVLAFFGFLLTAIVGLSIG